MGRSSQKVAAFALMALLAGCGQAPGTATRPILTDNALDAIPLAPVAAQPGQQAGPGQTEGIKMLQGLRTAYQRCTGFDSEIKSYSQGNFKAGQHVDELRKATTQAKLLWFKPNKTRAEVVTTSNPLLVGAALVTTNGVDVTARAKGLLSIFPFHFQASDAKLSNNRNHKFTENNPKSIIERLTAATAVWTVVGDAVVEGTPVKMVQVDHIHYLDKEITREVVGIDPATSAIRRLVMYNGTTKVIDHSFLKFSWNPHPNSDTFVL
ncbi:MAG: hypothetical protein JWM80_1938 [Cyanobacteria bacterium RYN_339]|nr:hypothetical protein [Cyanobacteria bacterium RYN_339]